MPGHVILSHGSDSGPGATKVSALARVAEALGWSTQRPDYRADDAAGYAGSVPARVVRLVDAMRRAPRPLVLVGSSMGAFVSGLASLEAGCDGLFLVALPVAIPECPRRFDIAFDVPGMLVHGYHDEVCPADAALAFARARRMPALMLDGDHRLSEQVPVLERQFRLFLESVPG
ncbi:MAG TPA: alpha/beta hydrolase [Rhodanobacteraceae bacterium]|nr:alpha/beta hydrolase [Rhodanobacteraceae bacterium]